MKKLFNLIIFVLALSGNSFAEPQVAKDTLKVKYPSVKMHLKPRGPIVGDLYINSPVEIQKTEGDWALVGFQAWVKRDELGSVEVKKQTPTIGKPSDVLSVERFTLKKVKEGIPRERVYLILTLKNLTPNLIKSWRAMLVAQSMDSVLFREQIADNTKTIEAGKSVELSFFWEPSEEPFSHLVEIDPSKLKLELFQVVLE